MKNFNIEPGELIMGIGDGGGNLFVRGDYDSITTLQNKLFELEELRREKNTDKELNKKVKELNKKLEELINENLSLRFELAAAKSNDKIPKGGFIPGPYYPQYPDNDMIWSNAPIN